MYHGRAAPLRAGPPSLPSADVPDPTPLAGRVAFVTGASRGIGRAIALALADAGADVAVADVHPEPFQGEQWYRLRQRVSGPEEEVPTAAAVAALGPPLDGRSPSTCPTPTRSTAAVAACTDELGPPDIVVNNAGIVNNIASIADDDARRLGPRAVGSTSRACSTPCGRRRRGWPSAGGAG